MSALEEVHQQEVLPSLEELAETVRREHELVTFHGTLAIQHAIACGEAATAIKGLLPHGEFHNWMAKEGYVLATMQQYMRVARHKHVVQHFQPPTIKEALRLLGGQTRTDAHPPEVVAEVKRMRAEGLSYRAIREETGLGHTAARNIIDPAGTRRMRRQAYSRSMQQRRMATLEHRRALAARTGGGYSEGYSLLRKTAQILDRLIASSDDQETRRTVSGALSSLHACEDKLVLAMKRRQ